MEHYRKFFSGKRITLMGLGLLGRGVGDARFLAECGAKLMVTDIKTEAELKESLEKLSKYPNIRYTLGSHDRADFKDCDLVIHAAGVPLDSPYLAEARRNEIPITQSSALFARFAQGEGAVIVGITGTRGKTTTARMLYEILRAAGRKALLGGNVPGVSTLALLPQVTAGTTAVLELDSWQLQGFREEKISPRIAVFTTFYQDHLNYYHGSVEQYLADKAEIFLHQGADDFLVLGGQCADLVKEKYGGEIRAALEVARTEDVPQDWTLRVPGAHNRYNAACALKAARALGVPDAASKTALEHFAGVEGRLELAREFNGIKIYNDTTSTTPEATMAALEALDPGKKKNILLIMGGSDKGLDMQALWPVVRQHCKEVLLLEGSGTKREWMSAQKAFPKIMICYNLANALKKAVVSAEAGDIVLFSPAFASFGMFTNEYDRGERFDKAVQSLV